MYQITSYADVPSGTVEDSFIKKSVNRNLADNLAAKANELKCFSEKIEKQDDGFTRITITGFVMTPEEFKEMRQLVEEMKLMFEKGKYVRAIIDKIERILTAEP